MGRRDRWVHRGLGASGPPESPAALGPDAIATVLSRSHAVRSGWLKRTGDASAEPVQVVVPGAVSQRGFGGALAAHHLAATGQLVVKRRLRRAGPVPRDEHEYRSEEIEIEPEGNAAKSPGITAANGREEASGDHHTWELQLELVCDRGAVHAAVL